MIGFFLGSGDPSYSAASKTVTGPVGVAPVSGLVGQKRHEFGQ